MVVCTAGRSKAAGGAAAVKEGVTGSATGTAVLDTGALEAVGTA